MKSLPRSSRRRNAIRWFEDEDLYQISSAVDDRESEFSQILGPAFALDRFERLFGRPARSVLDAGCGSGAMLQEFKRLGVVNCHGFDPSTQAVRMAECSSEIVCWVGEAEEASTYDHLTVQPDVIVVHLTLALWSDPVQGLINLVSVLPEEGLIYVMDLSSDAEGLIKAGRNELECDYLRDQIDSSFNLTEIQGVLAMAAPGLEIETGNGPIGGFNLPDQKAQELLMGFRTMAALRQISTMAGSVAPDECFLSGWILKGGELNERSVS
ncbi:class I SAM-dependent methyltransferase [Arthrobacter antibioticus]|uniref:class I SAM-dependent methyltransferase n=1 Tax=Arthrobacter sp. H35-MC1 TaxID=3046203 RepID=UPI0024BAA8D6|nr:methyltransferase domain-containing protein [Arthrobacter sp. H35-MC1]MDJ0318633.1 methyltransferase domain-containing protein [Arthrobacter sp. H35-MC1]